jgi:beta-aspartyl-peptidase (threonine type)
MAVSVSAMILVHAGAGKWSGPPARRQAALEACLRAAERGRRVLGGGGSAVDAVVAAVVVLEDDPSCNAGTGAVANSDGVCELDACVMDGRTRTSGAVGALRGYRNPVLIADDIRRDGRYHLLVASGASGFARAGGRREDAIGGAGDAADRGNTVGAVALDDAGGLAAATSTGGVAGQLAGRIGDTPIVGAGNYADERAACSCTGAGESFARACTAFWAVERVEGDAARVADDALERTRQRFGGTGGLILLQHDGAYAARRTTEAMPWAVASVTGASDHGG